MSEKDRVRLLFTSVGRRVELIQAFRSAAARLNVDLAIYGVDSAGDAPALFYCDLKETVCRISDSAYIPQLLQMCRREKIDLVIPTIDTDLLLLAREKGKFERNGTRVLISDPDKIALCRDKRLTRAFFEGCALKSPATTDDWKKYNGGFPCFIKPMNGSSSVNAFKIETVGELEFYASRIFDYIIQPFIEGTEYTVDIFCDFEGRPIYITPRERIEVRSGEVIKSRIIKDTVINTECRLLVDKFHPIGPLTVQLIRAAGTGTDYFIEINPRFGGGAPLSMKGGADSAEALLRILSGDSICYQSDQMEEGTLYCRFHQSIAIPMAPFKIDIKAIVFDLDDTLYSEKEYVKSGFKEISRKIPELKGAEEELWSIFLNGEQAIDRALAIRNCYSEALKEQCLDIYRLQRPDIQLYPGVEDLLRRLRNEGYRLGIITDGRPEGQRAKIKALNLEEMVDEIVITDEIGGTCFRKPSDIPYRIMKEMLGIEFSEMVYVGDNASKDFTAPRNLGMRCIYFNNRDGLYNNPQAVSGGHEIKKIAEAKAVIDAMSMEMA